MKKLALFFLCTLSLVSVQASEKYEDLQETQRHINKLRFNLSVMAQYGKEVEPYMQLTSVVLDALEKQKSDEVRVCADTISRNEDKNFGSGFKKGFLNSKKK